MAASAGLFGSKAILSLSGECTKDDLDQIIKDHPAFAKTWPFDEYGFALPNQTEIDIIVVSDETKPRLAALGIDVAGDPGTGGLGTGNVVVVDKRMPKTSINIFFAKSSHNLIVLDQNFRARGNVRFENGDGNIAVLCNSVNGSISFHATFRYHTAGLLLGAGVSGAGTNFWIEGPDNAILVGDDCMISWGVWIRTADSHGIVDLKAGKRINTPRPIIIGKHVWLGQDVIVMPGGHIGAGSIIGARSIVTRPVPGACVAVGAPAKVVKRDTSWTRHPHPSPMLIEALQNEPHGDVAHLDKTVPA